MENVAHICTKFNKKSIVYLVIISQLHLHLAKLPEVEQSPNCLFSNSLFLLCSSSPQHLPQPSSFLRLCSLCWARCPKGAIAPLPWETHSWHSWKFMSLKPGKMTNSWRKKDTSKKVPQLSQSLTQKIGVVLIHRQVLPQPPMHFQTSMKMDSRMEILFSESAGNPSSIQSTSLFLLLGIQWECNLHHSWSTGKAQFPSLSTEVICPSPIHVNSPYTMLLTLSVKQFLRALICC